MVVGGAGGTVRVREVGVEEASALAALRYAWQAVEHGRVGLELDDYTGEISRWMSAHGTTHRAFLAERDGVPIAMAWLAVVERVPSPADLHRRAAMLQSVYVRPDDRGSGVGSAVVRALIDAARDAGYSYLMVHPSARSFAFYVRLGFAVSGTELELRLDGR